MKGAILWSLTTVRPLNGQAAAHRLWKLPVHFKIHDAEEKSSEAPHLRCAKICSEGGEQAGGGRGSSEKPHGETGAAAERANRGLPRKRIKSRAWQ